MYVCACLFFFLLNMRTHVCVNIHKYSHNLTHMHMHNSIQTLDLWNEVMQSYRLDPLARPNGAAAVVNAAKYLRLYLESNGLHAPEVNTTSTVKGSDSQQGFDRTYLRAAEIRRDDWDASQRRESATDMDSVHQALKHVAFLGSNLDSYVKDAVKIGGVVSRHEHAHVRTAAFNDNDDESGGALSRAVDTLWAEVASGSHEMESPQSLQGSLLEGYAHYTHGNHDMQNHAGQRSLMQQRSDHMHLTTSGHELNVPHVNRIISHGRAKSGHVISSSSSSDRERILGASAVADSGAATAYGYLLKARAELPSCQTQEELEALAEAGVVSCQDGGCLSTCGSYAAAPIIFCFFVAMTTIMLLNLVLAVLMQQLQVCMRVNLYMHIYVFVCV
jgi:hypothetical protein